MKLSKSFGQVFLRDSNYIAKIMDSLDIDGKDVLEIGPGDGKMTELLAKKANFLYCVEVDLRLCNFLTKKFSGSSNIKIIHSDIIKFDLSKLNKKVTVFSNAPYQISNYLIRYLTANRGYINQACLTFQKEFVDKLIAVSSSKAYGYLSCYVQFYAEVEKLFSIPACAFFPAPKVDSALMKIGFYQKPPYKIDNEDYLFAFIRKAFSHRRKKLINALAIPKDKAREIFASLNIDIDARAENVSLSEYVSLVNILTK